MKLKTSSVRTTVRPQLKVTALRKSDLKRATGGRGTQCGNVIHCLDCGYLNHGKTLSQCCSYCSRPFQDSAQQSQSYGTYGGY